jgi:hypothetical protein
VRQLVCVLSLAACSYRHGASGSDSAPTDDAPRDAAHDAPGDSRPSDAHPDATPDAAPIPIQFIKEAHGQQMDAVHSTETVTIAGQVAGDFNAVVVSWYTVAAHVTSLTDSANNVYTFVAQISDGTIVQQVYYNGAIAASASNAVTVQFDSNAEFCELRVLEYRGLASTQPIDNTSASVGNGSPMSIGPLTTSHAHDLLFAAYAGSVTNPGTGYTQRITFVGDYVEDRTVTMTGSYSASATGGAGGWVGQLIAFAGAN